MPVPTSGAISLANLQTELEGVAAGNNTTSITEFYAGGSYVNAGSVAFPGGTRTAIPTSGAISLRNFYGAKWFGADQGYAYATPGTYTVTIANRTGFINNFRYSGVIQAGGGGGGGAHGSTAPNTDVINSGGGGGGGEKITFNGTATGSTLSFTIVIGAGGDAGGNSTAANPYTPGGTVGGAGGNSQLYINGALIHNARGGGGGGAGLLKNTSPHLGTSGVAGTHYGTGNSPGAGFGSNDYRAAGGRGGDTIFGIGALGFYASGFSPAPGGRGAGGAGGGGEGGDLRNGPSAGGAGYARIFFKSDFPYTTSASWSSAGSYSWTVPTGIYYVQANITGAGGGGSYSAAGGWNVVFINVTPGEVLSLTVGGPGGVSSWGDATLTAAGGYAGGGGGAKSGASYAVAGGGGYSGIFRGTTALAIAGGGGGFASEAASGQGSDQGAANIINGAPGGSPDCRPMWDQTGASPVTSNSGAYLSGTTGLTGKICAAGGGGAGYAGGGANTSTSVISGFFGGGGGSSYKHTSVGEYYRLPGECTGGSWAAPYGNTGTQGQIVIYY